MAKWDALRTMTATKRSTASRTGNSGTAPVAARGSWPGGATYYLQPKWMALGPLGATAQVSVPARSYADGRRGGRLDELILATVRQRLTTYGKPVLIGEGLVGAAIGNGKARLGWFRDARCVPPDWPEQPVNSQTVDLEAPDGGWTAEFINPANGKALGTERFPAKEGRLRLILPEFRGSIAVRLRAERE